MNKERLKEISRYLTDLSFIRRNVEDTSEMSNEEIMIRQLLIECLDLKEQNNNLQHKLKEKAKVIDEAIELTKKWKTSTSCELDDYKFGIDLLEILERGKNGK